MKTREQIYKKIENEKETLEGLKKSSDSKNPWLDKQIAIIENRIQELEWVLESDNCISQVLIDNNSKSTRPEEFLQQYDFFQKDESGIYSYISENNKHLINLEAILEAYGNYINANK